MGWLVLVTGFLGEVLVQYHLSAAPSGAEVSCLLRTPQALIWPLKAELDTETMEVGPGSQNSTLNLPSPMIHLRTMWIPYHLYLVVD